MRSNAARVPSVDPSLTTMISLGAENSIVSNRSTTAATVPASLNTGTMIETRASGNVTRIYSGGSVNAEYNIVTAVYTTTTITNQRTA